MVAELLVELAAWTAGAAEAAPLLPSVLGAALVASTGALWLRRRQRLAEERRAINRWKRLIRKVQRIRFKRRCWAALGHLLGQYRHWPKLQ